MSFINTRPRALASADEVDAYKKMLAENNLPTQHATTAANEAAFARVQAEDNSDPWMTEVIVADGEVRIAGYIDVATYNTMVKAFNESTVNVVKIHSFGGVAATGLALYNLLQEKQARIEIDGIAYSAASIAAMAGAPLVMSQGAMLGIHQPWSMMVGNASDMRNEANALDVISKSMLGVYQARVKPAYKSRVAKEYEADTIVGAEDAVKYGLADEVKQPQKTKSKNTKKATAPKRHFGTKFDFVCY